MHLSSSFALSHVVINMAGYAIAVSVSTLRYSLRRSQFGSLQLDDWIHLGSLVLTFIYFVLGVVETFLTIDVVLPGAVPSDDTWLVFTSNTTSWAFWVGSIFTAKATFLILYRKIFGVDPRFLIWWRITVVLTTGAFIVAFFGTFLGCGRYLSDFSYNTCELTTGYDASLSYMNTRNILITTLPNCVSDVILMILPLGMLLKIQTSRARKLRMASVFALTLATIIMDILSLTLTWLGQPIFSPPTEADLARNFAGGFFFQLEPTLAIIISALPVVLFSKHGGRKNSYNEEEANARRLPQDDATVMQQRRQQQQKQGSVSRSAAVVPYDDDISV